MQLPLADTGLLERLQDLCASPRLSGPERLYPAETYLEHLTPFLAEFGITRLADVTGLDRLGIPVVQAIRPLARSNAVNQGKGLSLAEAAVSAAVEALETYACENLDPERCEIRSPSQAVKSGAAALADHLQPDPPDGWCDMPITFLKGIELRTGTAVDIPAALVSTDYTPSSPHAISPFVRTTTGLGGGATLEEAVLQGCFEVLERSSTGRAMETHGFFERCRLNSAAMTDERTAGLVQRVQEAGLLFAAYECLSAGAFPVVWVRLLDDRNTPTSLPYPSDGFACRQTLDDAVRAACLEAVQTRAAVIAGGREDITWRYYPTSRTDPMLDFESRQMREAGGREPLLTGQPGPLSVRVFAEAFAAVGKTAAIVPVLAREDIPLYIVRVVALNKTDEAPR